MYEVSFDYIPMSRYSARDTTREICTF